MQRPKEDTYRLIRQTAYNEFMANGFKDTSMRTIAKKSGVTLSNIYNYFKNKDDILETILHDTFQALEDFFSEHNKPDNINRSWFDTEDVADLESFNKFITFITENKEELDLLLHKCSGSKYENVKDYFIDKYTEASQEYLTLMKEKYPQVNKDITPFFIHTVAAWWIQILSEIVSHDLNEQEILAFNKEFMTFGAGGWQRLMHM